MAEAAYNKEMGLSDWVRMFRDIYFPAQNYGRSAFELFTHLVKVFGAGSHYLFRLSDAEGSRKYVAKVFAWYCALANRLAIDIDDALWQKYPNVCPRCIKAPCQCGDPPLEIDPERLASAALENAHARPRTLRDWQTMFAHIYRGPSGKSVVPPSRERLALVFARIAEELGEVAEALGQDPTIDADADMVLKNEMADLAAWIFALANNLQHVGDMARGISLADVAWDLYPGHCHRCQEPKCICTRGAYALELAEKGAMAPSHWDERTGLANDKALRRYTTDAQRRFVESNEYAWSMIFLDLDNFGAINKTHSHAAGDEVLRVAADQIKTAAGKDGIAFRRGGEEFVVVLRANYDAAVVTAESLRRKLAASPFQVSGAATPITVTASIGVASSMGDGVQPAALEALAESRAREAKQAGKNQVVPAPTQEHLRGMRKA